MTPAVMRVALPVLAASSLTRPVLSQAVDSTGSRTEATWAVSVANRGISTNPTSVLAKPTATVDMSIRRGGFSVDPQFRFGLDGTPWSFVFRGRYRLVDGERLGVTVDAHPVFAFRTATVSVNGVSRKVVVARHFAAGELASSYALSRSVSVGTYYLYSHGLDADVTRHTHLVAARAGLATLRLPARFAARLDPQVYYLRLDDEDGTYLDSRLTLAKRELPVSVSGVVNRPICTNIRRGGAVRWNVSLNYAPGLMH
jgi:hypothetical protein